MRYLPALFLALVSLSVSAQGLDISAEQWRGVRTARDLVAFDGWTQMIASFDRQPQGLLLVRHGHGEPDRLRAEALRSWLVSLGIPSAQLRLEPEASLAGRLALEVRAHGAQP